MCWRRLTYIQTNECGMYIVYVAGVAAATAAVASTIFIFIVGFAGASVPMTVIDVAPIQSTQIICNCTVFLVIVVC